MSDYSEFFLNSGSEVVHLELLEIAHPNFSQTYYIVRNAMDGITVIHEDASSHDYIYYPAKITPVAASDDMDQVLQVELGDLGEILPTELDLVDAANGFNVKPTMNYRVYRSDDLTAPLYGPLKFEITSLPFKKQGVAFEARAPRLNMVGTGEIYAFDRFPMLRGFI
jgi:hypothetical protein